MQKIMEIYYSGLPEGVRSELGLNSLHSFLELLPLLDP